MCKIRQTQLQQIHQELFEITASWSQVSSQTLLQYVFEHGVKHALYSDNAYDMSTLILDYQYELERLRRSDNTQLHGLIQDFEALQISVETSPTHEDLALMSTFLKTKGHLLQLQDFNWGFDRIFHQLALEHADESSLTQRAECWLEKNQPGWSYWRRKRRAGAVPVNPCLQTLLTKEEEWASIEEWQGIMVAYDCSSYLWVWDHHSNDVLLHIEITGYTCGPGSSVALWDAETLYLWEKLDDDNLEPTHQLDGEFIATVVWLSETSILIATESGNLYCLNLKDLEFREVVRFDDNRRLCVTRISGEKFLVHQEGWHEEDDEEWDEEGDAEDEEEQGWHDVSEEDDPDADDADDWEDDKEEYDEDEEWEESEEEPSDPRILLCQKKVGEDGSFAVEELCVIEQQVGSIHVIGEQCVVVDKSGDIFLYEISSKTLLHSWSMFQGIGTDVFVLSKTHIGLSQWDEDSNSAVHVLSIESPYTVLKLSGHTDMVTDMKGLANDRVVTTSFDTTAIVWDLMNGTGLLKINNVVPHDFSGVIVLDDKRIALWSVSGHILIWDIEKQEHIGTLMGHTSSVSDLIQLSDSMLASIAMFEPSLRIWNPSLAPIKPPIDNHDDVVISSLSIRNELVLTGSHDKTLRVWEAASGRCSLKFTEHTQPIECMDWISDNEIVSGDWAGMLLRWNTNGHVLQRYEGHTDWVRGFTCLPDGRLLSWSDDADLRVWDLVSGECIETLQGHEAPVRGGLSLDEHLWLSWSEDATLRIWSIETFECVMILAGHDTQIDTVRLLSDGRIVASNYEDMDIPAVVKVWDGESGECLQTFTGLDADVIELVVVENQLYVRTHSNIWSWGFNQPDQPREWLLKDFEIAESEIWKMLHPKEFGGLDGLDQVTADGGKVSSYIDRELVRWVSDGNWKVHHQVGKDTLIATCWNDVAFLQLHSVSSFQ